MATIPRPEAEPRALRSPDRRRGADAPQPIGHRPARGLEDRRRRGRTARDDGGPPRGAESPEGRLVPEPLPVTFLLLDEGPLSLVTNPRASDQARRCNEWLEAVLARGVRVLVPAIADYEPRRELLRANKLEG